MQFDRNTRRAFITLLSGAAAWPFVARAQQSERMRRVGVLTAFAEDDRIDDVACDALFDALGADAVTVNPYLG